MGLIGRPTVVVVASLTLVQCAVAVEAHGAFALPDRQRASSQEVGKPVIVDGEQSSGPIGFTSPNAVLPWGLDRIDQRPKSGDGRYRWGQDGTGVDVYVMDSGVNQNHTDFTGRIRSGWSYRTDPTIMAGIIADEPVGSKDRCENQTDFDQAEHPLDVNSFDYPSPLPTPLQDPGWPDNQGHGTHVTGIIGGTSTGVAKGVTLVPVRVTNSCGDGSTASLVGGLTWILNDHVAGHPAVVNMSLGYTTTVPQVEAAIRNLLNEGVTVVSAAGNLHESSCGQTPAGTAGTISVGASDVDDAETSFTNFGSCVDLFSPGRSIVSTSVWGTTSYALMSGTSMAAPHVAGAAAIYLQSDPGATPADVADWIFDRATACAVAYYSPSTREGLAMTPNLLLNVFGSAGTPCDPRQISYTTGDRSVRLSWSPPYANGGAEITGYVVSSSPATAGCTTAATTCTIGGLTVGTTYTFSVSAVNGAGQGKAISVSVEADGTPSLPTTVRTTARNKAVRVSWGTAAPATTYTVTASPGGAKCVTASSGCTVTGLRNGTPYKFKVTTTRNGYTSATAKSVTARPGFTVKITRVRRGSRTGLSSIVASISGGRVAWRATGRCGVSGSYLVASGQPGTCSLSVSVGRRGSWVPMSTVVKVQVI